MKYHNAIVAALLFLTGCMSTTRSFRVPYDKMEAITLKEFNHNQWDSRSTEKSSIINQRPGQLELRYFYWDFPSTKIRCDISLEAKENGITELSVYVKDIDSWLYPFNYSSDYALELVDNYKRKLSTGIWPKAPWTPGSRRINQ